MTERVTSQMLEGLRRLPKDGSPVAILGSEFDGTGEKVMTRLKNEGLADVWPGRGWHITEAGAQILRVLESQHAQSDAAAERSAHVSRGTHHGRNACCVCGRDVNISDKTSSYAVRVGPPLMQVCSADCSKQPPFHVEQPA